jgi:hypothetical protein
MAAGEDEIALTNPIPKDMQLPPTPPEEYSNAQKTGLETPPMETLQQQLLTPDNTPPGMVLNPPRPTLGRDVSSRANSFRTAREEQSREFLAAAATTGNQIEEGALSDDISACSDDDDDDDNDTVDEEPWRHIPGAFCSTPSTASSRNASQPSQRMASVSTPSTSSSDKAVRPKQYLDVESPPSTGSSRDIVREKRYRHDTESPLDRQRVPAGDHTDGSVSYAHSDRSSDEGDAKESETSQHENVEGSEEESSEESDDDGDDNEGEDWQNHVSYMAVDGENDSGREHEGAATPARTSTPSSRLSGHGRRVGGNGTDQYKGINNPPYSPSGISNKAAEQGLLKRGSDESSRQRSDDTPSPSVGAQQRRQKVAHVESPPANAAATPRAREREARRMNWLRQHAGTLASPDIPVEFLTAPPRNSNDLVYKHIQQANMDRFDALKNGQAVEAVVIPTDEARSRQLRHVTKRQSLRSISDNNSAYMPGGAPPKRDHNLRHKKALTPQKVLPKGSPEGTPNTRSASGSHSLRHEKRPLSGTGRPLQSNDASPVLTHTNGHSALQQALKTTKETPKLRHSSLPINLSSDLPKASPVTSDFKKGERRRSHALRRSSREYRLENNAPTVDHVSEHDPEDAVPQKDHSTVVETTTLASPNFLGFEAHHRNRNLDTPFSVSAVSDRTDMEVCEAQNVAYYPHSNESLLVVQHHSKPDQKAQRHKDTPVKSARSDEDARVAQLFPELPAQSPPAIAVNGKSIHTVESPLINPREAPMPPVIKFIPATPSHEDDEREIVPVGEEELTGSPQRRASLANRARRYSEVVVRPLFGRTLVTRSHHIHPSPTASEKRDERLHPNWVPNSFWQDDDDDEEYSDDEDMFERLPAGGDTSEHPRAKFPRNMSVRMPGFRGSGGFLLGNSLGMDRHGTNKRRPHVTPPGSADPTSTPKKTVRRVSSMDSVSSRTTTEGRIFSIPGTHTRLQYVGFQPLKDKIKKRRQTKEDAAREKRRAELKDQIGMRIVHDA